MDISRLLPLLPHTSLLDHCHKHTRTLQFFCITSKKKKNYLWLSYSPSFSAMPFAARLLGTGAILIIANNSSSHFLLNPFLKGFLFHQSSKIALVKVTNDPTLLNLMFNSQSSPSLTCREHLTQLSLPLP